MKFINRVTIVIFALGFMTACDMFDMDLQENPNAITPERASLNDVYNSVQLSFGEQFMDADFAVGAVSRMYLATSYTYQNYVTPNTLNGVWYSAYSSLWPDIDGLMLLAEPNGFVIHMGTAKVMKAYSMMHLVDLFGDVPYSEALQGTNAISPNSDPGQDVYNAAIALLDEAIADLESGINDGVAGPAVDIFYDGDASKWIKLANTLKLRAALNTGDANAINAVVNGGDFISGAEDDFAAQFGNQRTNPNSRHWMYNDHYEIGDGSYMNNYYMWLLAGEKIDADGIEVRDPRLRYYFFRKVDDSENQDQTTYGCHFSELPTQDDKPSWYEDVDPRIPYCYAATDGYIGRDHMNGEGIPPDGPVRTSWGLYPGGGEFDWDEFADTRTGGVKGGLGEGILPIMLSSFVDLMRAEAALTLGTSDDAAALLASGIQKSLDKVESFESIVGATMSQEVELRDGSSGTVKEIYGMTAQDKQDYIDFVVAQFNAADNSGKLDIVSKELMIAAWGNGLEAYNLYRRTGMPSNMAPALESAPGAFPKSFLLPADHVNRNSNVDQRSMTDPVFWNENGPDLY